MGLLSELIPAAVPCRGVAKLVKAPDFDSGIRRFDSFHPCQIFWTCHILAKSEPRQQTRNSRVYAFYSD